MASGRDMSGRERARALNTRKQKQQADNHVEQRHTFCVRKSITVLVSVPSGRSSSSCWILCSSGTMPSSPTGGEID